MSCGQSTSARSIRLSVAACRFFASAHSQIRSTVQPALFRPRVTSRSRALFRASFASQNARFCFGLVAWRGHPCQRLARQRSSIAKPLRMAMQSMAKTAIHKHRHPLRPKHKIRPHSLLLSLHLPCPPFILRLSYFKAVCLLHPVILAARISDASFISVSLLPVERMRDITSERLVLENTSGMGQRRTCVLPCHECSGHSARSITIVIATRENDNLLVGHLVNKSVLLVNTT